MCNTYASLASVCKLEAQQCAVKGKTICATNKCVYS